MQQKQQQQTNKQTNKQTRQKHLLIKHTPFHSIALNIPRHYECMKLFKLENNVHSYKPLMISFLPEAGFSALLLPDLLFHGRR